MVKINDLPADTKNWLIEWGFSIDQEITADETLKINASGQPDPKSNITPLEKTIVSGQLEHAKVLIQHGALCNLERYEKHGLIRLVFDAPLHKKLFIQLFVANIPLTALLMTYAREHFNSYRNEDREILEYIENTWRDFLDNKMKSLPSETRKWLQTCGIDLSKENWLKSAINNNQPQHVKYLLAQNVMDYMDTPRFEELLLMTYRLEGDKIPMLSVLLENFTLEEFHVEQARDYFSWTGDKLAIYGSKLVSYFWKTPRSVEDAIKDDVTALQFIEAHYSKKRDQPRV